MRPTVRTTVILGCAAVLLLAGCTGESPEPATSATSVESPTASATPTPTPTLTGPIDRSDAALGIAFENVPDVTGDARAALDVYTYFEVEYWRSTTEGVVSEAISAVADPAVVAIVQTQLDGNSEVTVGGENSIRIDDVVADAARATVTTCQDTTGVQVTDADGTRWSGSDLGEQATIVTTEMTKEPGLPWRVVAIDSSTQQC